MLPEPDEVRQIIRTLIDDWDTTGPNVEIGVREHILVGLTIYGLTAHTYALADAAMTLYDHEHYVPAVPLVRQALECAMTAVWIELTGHAGALALIHEQSRNVRNTLATYEAAGMPRIDEARQRTDADLKQLLKTATPAGKNFEKRCAEIEGGVGMYASYRSASQVSHASASVVDLYFDGADIDDIAPLGFALLTKPNEYSPDAWLGTLLCMVVQATSVWSRIDRDHVARTRMKALNTRLGTNYRQRLSVEGMRTQSARDRTLREWKADQARTPQSNGARP